MVPLASTAAGEAAEPLIGKDRAREERVRGEGEGYHDGERSEYDGGRRLEEDGGDEEDSEEGEGEGRVGAFVWGLTICAGVSGLLFGYDTGVISSTLISINTDLSSRPLTTLDKSLITSCTSFFALLASPLTGVLADSWGRKKVILIADILFVLGALWQAFTSSVLGMIAGRSVVGAAVGSASFVVPLYISELSPSAFRGRLVTVASLFITGGQVVAYIIGWLFSSTQHGWRWMVGLGALPAAIQFVMLFFMPETPRWLVRSGRKEQARRVLGRVYGEGGRETVKRVLRRVEKEVLEEESGEGMTSGAGAGAGAELTGVEEEYDDVVETSGAGNLGAGTKKGLFARFSKVNRSFGLLISVGGNRRALVIACMLQGFQQLCGFNSLMYFSATIFSLVGFRSPTLTSLSVALTNFAFTLVAFAYIDRIGRRRILLWSVPIMVIGLALCAVAFAFLDLPGGEEGTSSIGRFVRDVVEGEPVSSWDGKAWPLVILLAMVLYVAGYAIGMGNVPWQQSELFPLPVRALGSALATATNWASNTLIGLTFLPMMQILSPTGTFVAYALVCVVAWFTIHRIYPETAGLGLEEVGGLLSEGWGVQRGEEMRRERVRRREG